VSACGPSTTKGEARVRDLILGRELLDAWAPITLALYSTAAAAPRPIHTPTRSGKKESAGTAIPHFFAGS
jgi:hypothetical protein